MCVYVCARTCVYVRARVCMCLCTSLELPARMCRLRISRRELTRAAMSLTGSVTIWHASIPATARHEKILTFIPCFSFISRENGVWRTCVSEEMLENPMKPPPFSSGDTAATLSTNASDHGRTEAGHADHPATLTHSLHGAKKGNQIVNTALNCQY